jgi:hypothetical protein
VPPTLDRVMVQAFRKQAAMRTASVGALADQVGEAYGLVGGHRVWAEVPEGDLSAQIQARLVEMMRPPVEAPRPATAADSFFGEADALADDMPAAPVAQVSGVAPTIPDAALIPAGVPKSSNSKLLMIALGGGALLVGLVITLVIALAR